MDGNFILYCTLVLSAWGEESNSYMWILINKLLAQMFLLNTELHGNGLGFFCFFFLIKVGWVKLKVLTVYFSTLSLQKRKMQKQQKQGLPCQELQRRK